MRALSFLVCSCNSQRSGRADSLLQQASLRRYPTVAWAVLQNACILHENKLMASLQIRDLPGPLHQMLQLRARQHHRSLNQQALSDLQLACGGDPRERRRQAIADLQALASQQGVQEFDPSPEDLIRLDRSR